MSDSRRCCGREVKGTKRKVWVSSTWIYLGAGKLSHRPINIRESGKYSSCLLLLRSLVMKIPGDPGDIGKPVSASADPPPRGGAMAASDTIRSCRICDISVSVRETTGHVKRREDSKRHRLPFVRHRVAFTAMLQDIHSTPSPPIHTNTYNPAQPVHATVCPTRAPLPQISSSRPRGHGITKQPKYLPKHPGPKPFCLPNAALMQPNPILKKE